MLSQDFKKNSETMEKMMENQNFWMCSRKCLIIFGGAAVALTILILIIKAVS